MNRKWVLASLLVVLFLSSIESTVVTTAMRSIVADLGGIEWMNMVFSVYLLVMAVAAPIYGKFLIVMLAAGFALGMCRTVLTVLLQHAVENRIRGIAMSANALMNTLGQTVFAAIFGAVFNAFASGGISGSPEAGIRAVFIGVFAVMTLTFLISLRLPSVSRRELFGDGPASAA
jgi:hypothetical protein